MKSVGPTPLHLEKLDKQEFDVQLGPTIQGNGKLFEFSLKCCHIYHQCYKIEDMMLNEDGLGLRPSHVGSLVARCDNHKTLMKWYGCIPNRCSEHNKKLKSFIRTKNMQQKLHSKFELRRHHHIRMGTVGYPGSKIVKTRKLEDEINSYRKLLTSNFNLFRKRKIWKDNVDGGIWFFECTTETVDNDHTKIHPHLHVVMLCPNMFPIKQVNNYLAGLSGITLGRFQISTPRDKKGRIKKCTPYDAISYCTSYMKEEQQIDGRNRQTFGNLLSNK